MKRSLLFILAFLISLLFPNQDLLAQCAAGGGTCDSAPSVPCGSIMGTLDNIPPAGGTFPGCPGNTIDNPHWWAIDIFVGGNITVSVTPSNCQGIGSGGGLGAQAGLYQDCDPNSPNFGVQCSCTTGGMVFSGNLTPGTYYVMIDGCAADVCDYSIDVTPPQSTLQVQQPSTPVASNLTPCPGQIVDFFIPPTPGATNYTWSFPSGVMPIGLPPYCTSVSVIWGNDSGCVEVTASNDCSQPNTSFPICLDVPMPEGFEYGQYCFPSEPGWFHAGTNTYYPVSIDIPSITQDGCDSTIHLVITPYNDGFNAVFEQICAGEQTCVIGSHIFDSPTDTTIVLEGWAAGGCDSTIQVLVSVLEAEVTLDAPDMLNCENVAQGVTVTASGTADAIYSWSTNGGNIVSQPSDDQIIVDAPGWYIVEALVDGVSGECNSDPMCTAIDSILVTADFNSPMLTPGVVDVSCGGDSDGSASVSINPGTGVGPFTYVWDDPSGSTSSSINNLPAGTYTVTVSGSNGCTSVEAITVAEPAPVTLSLVGTTDASCNGGLDGSATVIAGGGTPTYTYSWPASANNQSTATAINLASGSYIVTVTDANGCTETLTVSVSEPSTMNVAPSANDATCNGGNDGDASVNVSGGTMPYIYAWQHDNMLTGNTANNLTAGSYSVTITDASGCREILTIDVNEPTAVSATSSVDNALCGGSADGSATLAPSGGTAPYTYSWPASAGNQTTATANNLTAGNYAPTVTDVNGCTFVASVDVNEPAAVLLSETNNEDVSCNGDNDGTSSISVTGGTAPYSFTWSGGQTSSSPTNLIAGSHTVTVTDANGCTEELMITINEPAAVTLVEDSTIPATCFGIDDGGASVVAGGGTPPYSFDWSGSSQSGSSVSDLAAGNHSVTVTDANGCTEELVITITQPSILGLSLDASTGTSCNGGNDGSATVSGNGGTAPYTYDWNSGVASGATNNNLTAGQHTVEVTDANGCTFEINIDITEPSPVEIMEVASDDPSCNGDTNGSATVDASGGTFPYTFDWETGATGATANNLPAGSTTVTVTDANGCTEELEVVLTDPTALATAIDDQSDALCNGSADGSATVSGSGGTAPYSYVWPSTNTNATENNLAAGIYTVTVRDANGCSETIDVTIGEPTAIVLIEDSIVDVSCNSGTDGSASISASGGFPPFSYAWSSGTANGASATDLAAGPVTVTVTDANGCTEEIALTVNEPTVLQLAIDNSQDVNCNSGTDGSTSAAATGGTPPYSYAWDDPASQSAATANNLAAGTYNVVVTDANGCTETTSITISEPTEVTAVAVATDALCNGNADGSIDVEVMGGTPPYSYNWDGGLTANEDQPAIAAGTYNVTITDANGCSVTTSALIDEPAALDASANPTIAGCGVNDGSISLTVNGGTMPYAFDWDNGADDVQNPTNLFANTYTVIITDANGCTFTVVTDVVNPNPPSVSSSFTDVNCFNGDDGTIDLEITGGTAPFTYNWSPALSNAPDHNAVTAGTYMVTITDSKNCTVTDVITISEPAEPVGISLVDLVQATCGSANGSVTIAASGGTPPYSYLWSNMTNTPANGSLTPGTYTITVTDANGCSIEEDFNVSEPNALQFVSITPTDVLCNGGSDGAIDIELQGGAPPYNYSWDYNGLTTEDLANLPADDYNVTVTDGDGCTVATQVTIAEPAILTAIADPSIASCGLADGNISLTVNGGTPPYSFLWDNGDTNEDPGNLAANTYSVVITDANGCTFSVSADVVNPNPPQITVDNFDDVLCNGGTSGSITISVNGGSGSYTYDWMDLPGGNDPKDRTGLTFGTYEVLVTDSDNCTDVETITLTEPTALTLDMLNIVEAVCGQANGSVSTSTTGGTPPYTYAWSGNVSNSSDANNLFPGVYILTVTDANGCTISDSYNVTEPNALQATELHSDVLCNGGNDGSIDISPFGGTPPYTFAWNTTPSQTTEDVTDLSAGTYTVTITDMDGCTFSLSAEVNQPEALEITGVSDDATCNLANGSISLNVTGGVTPYTYDWLDPTVMDVQNPQNLFAGTYEVIVTDANGCTDNFIISVITPNGLQVSVAATDANCFGDANGSITSQVQGGIPPYMYSWSNGASTPDLNNLPFGNYILTITDADGCTVTAADSVNQPAPLLAEVIAPLDASCNGSFDGSIDLNVLGGVAPYTYLWDNGAGTQEDPTGLPAGTYIVTVTDANGCSTTEEAEINEPTALEASAIATDASCNSAADGSIDATVTGGTAPYTYSWTNGAGTGEDPANLQAGSYTLEVMDANGCTITTSATIGQPAAINITLIDESDNSGYNITCSDASDGFAQVAAVGGTAPYTFLWDNGVSGDLIENVTAGVYTVVATDVNGCTQELEVTMTAPLPISVDAQIVDPTCFGDGNGFIFIEDVTGGSGPFVYSFNDGPFSAQPQLTNLHGGSYAIVVQDANGCEWEQTVQITEPSPLLVDVGDDDEITLGDSILLQPVNNGSNIDYTWIQGDAFRDSTNIAYHPWVMPLTTTVYEIEITDDRGCRASDLLTIFVNKERPIFIPNAFSPNGDGINDYFQIFASEGIVKNVNQFIIFDRWGEVVFEARDFVPTNSTDMKNGWDGLFKGDALNPAVFVYYAEIEFIDGWVELYKGDVTLVASQGE